MKIGTTIQVINNNPINDQSDIDILIGKKFNVLTHWKQENSGLNEGEIQINSKDFGGIICLNKDEYIEL